MQRKTLTVSVNALLTSALFTAALLAPTSALAQAKVGSIHGHAQNYAGLAIPNVDVFVTPDGQPKDAKATFHTDANGDYKGTDVPVGTYIIVLQDPKDKTKEIWHRENIKIDTGADVQVDFDLTSEAYLKSLTPEVRKQLEENKKQMQATVQANMNIKHLNEILAQERDARKAKNYDQAFALAQQVTQGKPDEAIGWYEQGEAQMGLQKYDDAMTSFKKALETNAAAKKPQVEINGAASAGEGEAYNKLGKLPEASAAYDAAAKADPTNAAMFYTNESILLNASGKSDEAAAAADKAIAADPKKAMAYYLKGQALIGKATSDATGHIVAPPGCVDAYQKYLELDPNGPHAQEVSEVLEGIGVKVQNSYHKK